MIIFVQAQITILYHATQPFPQNSPSSSSSITFCSQSYQFQRKEFKFDPRNLSSLKWQEFDQILWFNDLTNSRNLERLLYFPSVVESTCAGSAAEDPTALVTAPLESAQHNKYTYRKDILKHGYPKWPKHEKNGLAQTPYFLKRVYARVSENGKMKMFHSYPKE